MSVAKQMKIIPYKGKTISIYEITTHGWKHYFAQVDGMTVNAPRTRDIKQAVQQAVTQIERHMGAQMSKFSLVDKITQGTEEAEREKQERTGALPPGEKPSENPQDPAQGLPGDVSGDPMFKVPTKKTDQEMQAKPGDILNEDMATEMGAADTIEAAIKRVVIEAIKEAATPEGHVNAEAVNEMGAAK